MNATLDPVTGRVVQQITPAGSHALLAYFTHEVITEDNRGVLVACELGGRWLPFLVYPDEGYMVCLSDSPPVSPFHLAIGGDRVIYVDRKARLGYVPISGGEFRPIVEIPDEPGEAAASACGRYAAVMFYRGRNRLFARNVLTGHCHSKGSEQVWMQPQFCLLHVDLDTGVTKGVAGGADGARCHPMISPADPFRIEYCDFAPWQQRQRMWTARYHPGSNYVAHKPLYPQTIGHEAVGHEFFLQDGNVAAIWMRYDRIGQPDHQPNESGIMIIDPETEKFQIYRTPGLVWNHPHGRDGKVFVSEGGSDYQLTRAQRRKLPPPAAAGWRGTKQDLITRYEVAGKSLKPTPLCVSGTSWKDGNCHPHPVLDRRHRYAYFNSDRPGHQAVYRVALD